MLLRLHLTAPSLFIVLAAAVIGSVGSEKLGQYIDHFEGLNYDIQELHEKHLRAKRSLDNDVDHRVELKFSSHGRDFHLRLKRDTEILAKNFVVDRGNEVIDFDTSQLYVGKLNGEAKSHVHGTIVGGLFEGKIYLPDAQYYVEPALRHFEEPQSFHSVVYRGSDVNHPHSLGGAGCGVRQSTLDWMRSVQEVTAQDEKEAGKNVDAKKTVEHHRGNDNKYASPYGGGSQGSRVKRGAREGDTICGLYLQSDHTFYEKYSGSTDTVLTQLVNHVNAIKAIYSSTLFKYSDQSTSPDGVVPVGTEYRSISFTILRVTINTTDDADDLTNPFRAPNIGVEKFLELNSEMDHDEYCLAYVFADRDFDDGVLGLAWVASPESNTRGGICDKFGRVGGAERSLNTGIVTVQNYGSPVPTRVSEITFAHEVGHNFGSPHDYPDPARGCVPSELDLTGGNYIMYASATSGNEDNNNEFSACSIDNMTLVLYYKGDCFIDSDEPFCGNSVVEDGEECDCGYDDECDDKCCIPKGGNGDECMRALDDNGMKYVCSPSEGDCCDAGTCSYETIGVICMENDGQCINDSFCSGSSAACPVEQYYYDNLTECNQGREVCILGECTGSICQAKGLNPCYCDGESEGVVEDEGGDLLCHLCCSDPAEGDEAKCKSTSAIEAFNDADNKPVVLYASPGTPCKDLKGYCDVFYKCRDVDADGPLSRLKDALLNPELIQSIADWVTEYWWAVILMVLGLIIVMGLFIKLCSVHTPSSNPKLPPPRPMTLRRSQHRHPGAGSHHNTRTTPM